jgi:hypothetical protein
MTAEDAPWKERYRIPTYSVSGVAKNEPSRGVVSTNKDGELYQSVDRISLLLRHPGISAHSVDERQVSDRSTRGTGTQAK